MKVSVLGSHVGPGSAKTDIFLCPPPTSSLTGAVAGTSMAQSCASVVCSSGTGTGSFFLSQSETFLLSVSCALTAAWMVGFDMKGELQGGHSRCVSGLRNLSSSITMRLRVIWAFLDSEVVLRYVAGRRTLSSSMSLRPRVR